jgi:hypothetical protein
MKQEYTHFAEFYLEHDSINALPGGAKAVKPVTGSVLQASSIVSEILEGSSYPPSGSRYVFHGVSWKGW